MGHGCHDCACPNGCECDEITARRKAQESVNCCNGTFGCAGRGEKHWCSLRAENHTTKVKPNVNPTDTYSRADALELVYLYSKDLLAYWPQFSFKTVPIMMKKMDAIRQAVDAVK